MLSMPQVSFEFLYVASLSRRRHGFDFRTERQSFNHLREHSLFLAFEVAPGAGMYSPRYGKILSVGVAR